VTAKTGRADPLGLALLAVAVIGWGSNWPPLKYLLGLLPPMAARAWPGLAAALLLMTVVAVSGVSLRVPLHVWPRLVLIALLNITAWMVLATLSLGWLSASEGTIVAYTMPVWTALLAWPVLGERPSLPRLFGLALSLAGVVLLIGARGLDIGLAKLPGVLIGLSGCTLFALGTVITKRWPIPLPPAAGVAWQVLIGMLPVVVAALILPQPDWSAVPKGAWAAMAYMALLPLSLCYLAWFAALRRLPASLATQGSLLAPVTAVLGAAIFLGEPLGWREILALTLVLGGVVTAARG
jgi:drug/metabolite transporter (DMT)-like permease